MKVGQAHDKKTQVVATQYRKNCPWAIPKPSAMPRTRLTDIPQQIGAKSPTSVACVLVSELTLSIENAFR